MKKTILSALILNCVIIFQNQVFSQENKEAKTLFGNENPIKLKDIGFLIAPAYGFTQIDGSSASLFNVRGGINLRDKFSIGAYFNTSINQIKPRSEVLANIYMDYWSVGGFAEYTLLSKKIVHLTFPLYVGYGEVQMDNENGTLDLDESNFFQIEPTALLEINLHQYIRFNIGTGYRFVSQMNYRNLNQSDLSGITGYAGIKFGLFR